mmetsp:Transcript_29430/g.67136  ORF Transcript_29430/g.67136 Transcript_29430/m.67136 type:complete len:354 (-) Transcript_29430:1064-2125(-)
MQERSREKRKMSEHAELPTPRGGADVERDAKGRRRGEGKSKAAPAMGQKHQCQTTSAQQRRMSGHRQRNRQCRQKDGGRKPRPDDSSRKNSASSSNADARPKAPPQPKPNRMQSNRPCVAENILSSLAKCRCDEQVLDYKKDQIKDLPKHEYRETKRIVVVASDPAAVDRAVRDIRAELSVSQRKMRGSSHQFRFLGFDTETKPKFHKGGGNHPPALLQLGTPTSAYLIRLRCEGMKQGHSVMTEDLVNLLSDPSIIKVGVGIRSDATELNRVYNNCCGDLCSYQDLMPLSKLRYPKLTRRGLRNLTATVLRRNLPKSCQMSNWERQLSESMITYAAADALVSLDLLNDLIGE